MAYRDSKQQKTVYFSPRPCPLYPNWQEEDCECCGGLEWSTGYEPRECDNCAGNGRIFRHIPSGVLAQWPGGPFLGREIPSSAIEDSTNASR